MPLSRRRQYEHRRSWLHVDHLVGRQYRQRNGYRLELWKLFLEIT